MHRKPNREPAPRAHGSLRRAALLALATAAGAAGAQGIPDAGRLLQQEQQPLRAAPPPPAPPKQLLEAPVRPTVEMPEGVTVVPTGFRISGAVSFPQAELAALIQPWVGRRLDLAGLNEAASAITRLYQNAGHLLSYAYLPAQRVADGVIEIAVLEGHLDGAQVVDAPDVRLRDELVQARFADLIDKVPVLEPDLERRLLLLNDIPGVVARAAFTPGASTGAAQAVVSVAEDPPLATNVTFDNYGSRASGEYRAGAGLQFRDLFGWGDSTQAQFSVTNRGALVSGSLGTSVPVGTSGWVVGANLSSLRYALGGSFTPLGAEGAATALAVTARYPLLRRTDANVNLLLDASHKRLRDDVQLLGTSDSKSSSVGTLGLNFDFRDRFGGASAGSFSNSGGDLLDNGSNAGYRRMNFSIAREQALFGRLSIYGKYSGQIARDTLDSSEKLALAGPSAVRAYGPDEAVVDDGRIGSAELRWSQDYLGGNLLWSIFYDHAEGRYSLVPVVAEGNSARLTGAGLGLQWSAGNLGASATLAWRGEQLPSTDGDSRPRIYFQLYYAP